MGRCDARTRFAEQSASGAAEAARFVSVRDSDAAAATAEPVRRAAPSKSAVRLCDRAIGRTQSDERLCWTILGVAMAISVGVGLWLTRGETFHADDLLYYVANQGLHPRVLLAPHNGHLILIPRLMYAVVFELFGPRHYVVFRLLEMLGVALVAGLFYALARRRVGNAVALAPSILLLFLGSAWQDSLDPVGIAHVYCIAAGLAALLALERGTPRADLMACAMLLLSVATFSVGLAFVVGVAVSVLLRPDRFRRAWIFLVPLVLYLIWFVAPKLHGPAFTSGTDFALSNVLVIPSFFAQAAAAMAAAVTGLSYNFDNPTSYTIDSPWGYVVAAIAVAALVMRVRRGAVPAALWTSLAVLLSFWLSTALVTHLAAEPDQDRYVYDAAVVALVVAADAAAGIRFSHRAIVAVAAVTLFSLVTNLALMRAAGGYLRSPSAADKAELGAVDIARNHASANFDPVGEPTLGFLIGGMGGVGPYLAAVARNGSFADTPAELRRAPEADRQLADGNLVGALGLRLVPASSRPAGAACLTTPSRPNGTIDLTVRPPGLLIRAAVAQQIRVHRFASAGGQTIGTLKPGSFSELRIPADGAPDPWHVVADSGPVTVCSLAP